MSLFKILSGDSSRISTNTTAFHEGWCYFSTDNGGLYVDAVVDNSNKRIRVTSPGSTSVSATLLASGWSDAKQTISVAGVTANSNGTVGVSPDITDAAMEAAKNAELHICSLGEGTLTIKAFGDVPTCDFPIIILLFP